MNLVTEPWIPVVRHDGSKELVSLNTIFSEGLEIRDLSVNPPQRIALMRLLICITQAALDGPEDEQDWLSSADRIDTDALLYLTKWQDHFFLYGKRPFMQIPDLKVKAGNEKQGFKPFQALDCRSPFGGSNTLLFSKHLTKDSNSIDNSSIALDLITFLNFSTAGKIGQGVWNNQSYNGATFAAPCIKAVHTFTKGKNIIETLHLNLLTKKGVFSGIINLPNGEWGKPAWEIFPKSENDEVAFTNSSSTYLGRLVPFSRLVKIDIENGKCIISPPPPSHKIEHLPSFREPSTTVLLSKRNEPYYMAISSGKHIWRDLGSTLTLSDNSTNKEGPLNLKHIKSFHHLLKHDVIDVWTGGLELGANAAKLNDFIEWLVSIPTTLFGEHSLLLYEKGVLLANAGEQSLKSAVIQWHKEQSVELKTISTDSASITYWGELDKNYFKLIDASSKEHPLNTTWYPIVVSAMEHSLTQSCPHTTPRQIQAFAKAKQKMCLKKIEE